MDGTSGAVGKVAELDVESFAQGYPGDQKPEAQVYIIRIDRDRKPVPQPALSGREILHLVRKTPETHKLFQKLADGSTSVIAPDDVVSFVAPGIERFQTIPRDTTDGGESETE
jgi:hypothetical protein